jgi:hypothetical protein
VNGAKLTAKTIVELEANGAYAINVIATSKSGTGDVIACMPPHGRFMMLEIKGDGDTVKALQYKKLDGVIKAGGVAMFVRSLEHVRFAISLAKQQEKCPPTKREDIIDKFSL